MLFLLLKRLQLLISKFETFIIKLKVGFTVLPNLKKKFTEENWRNRGKNIVNKLTKSRFWKINNCACENYICFTSITAPQKSSNGARVQRMKTDIDIPSETTSGTQGRTFEAEISNLFKSIQPQPKIGLFFYKKKTADCN